MTSCHLIWNTWTAPIQWAAPCHWQVTFSPLQRENSLNNKTKCFFFLWSVTWLIGYQIGSFLIKSRGSGKGIWKRRSRNHEFSCYQFTLFTRPSEISPGIELAKYVKTKCGMKKLGQKHHNLSHLPCDESRQFLQPPCECAGTRTGQQVNSMFLLWIVYLSRCIAVLHQTG